MSSYSEGQTHQLMEALERGRWSAEDVTRLGQSSQLAGIKDVLLGQAEIKPIEHLIDLDADPFVPQGWSLAKEAEQIQSRARGQLVWDPNQITLWLAEKQKTGWIKGYDLRQELAGQKVLNANVLDFLLKHPELIPEEWKGKVVFFWGTIYRGRGPDGGLCVRYLDWDGRAWDWNYSWLKCDWYAGVPALLLASAA